MTTGNQNNIGVGLPRWKRVLDVGIIILSLPVTLPLAIVLTILIRSTSKGPVLFRQERVGYQGLPFMCLKFRTMHCNAETRSHQGHLKNLMQSDAPMTKMDVRGDSRIIPLGRFVRALGLDELPQLLNVLQGDMSVVGPRPCIPYEAEQFLPWQRERFNALPGLTGLWQVSGKNRTTFTQMMQLDIQYTRTKSLWLDLKIIFLTPATLLVQLLDLRSRKKVRQSLSPTTGVVAARAMDQQILP